MITRQYQQVMQPCVQPYCTSMAKTKRVTKGVGIVQYSTIQKKHKSKLPPTLTPTKIPFQKQCRHAIPRPRVHSLIVVLLRLATGRCGVICPPVANYDLYPTPSRQKNRQKSPSKNEVATPRDRKKLNSGVRVR